MSPAAAKLRPKKGARTQRIRQAVILAGGAGSRLTPYTDLLPKPLMPVGERPIIEILVRQLARAGMTDIIVALGAGAKLIKLFLGDGSQYGCSIRYVTEKSPLGTAGPLRKITNLDAQFLVLNGDLLTDIRFADFAKKHVAAKAAATIAVCRRRERSDFGIVLSEDGLVTGYREKPTHVFEVSMGIYAFSKEILRFIPQKRFDFPELVSTLLKRGIRPHIYRFHGAWLDIGRREDWERAAKELKRHPRKYLK